MRVYKVAWLLFKNNIRLYRFYILVLTCTIAVYYNFLAIYYNPYVSAIESKMNFARIAGLMSSVILFFVLLFFMNHVNAFFYKQRYKEIATYMLMGIKKNQIGKVIAIESIIVGGVALGIGSIIGILFSKLFFLLLGSTYVLNVRIPFYFSIQSVITLVILMSMILGILALKNIILVNRERLITLLNASRQQEREPKQRVIRGIVGIVCIGFGYYFAADFLSNALETIILVSVGTYLVFSGFFSLLLSKAIQNKNISYKHARLISLSNILFRLETNYRNYAATAILCAATLTAFMTSLAVKQFERENLRYEMPYSLSYINGDESINKKVIAKINESKHELVIYNKVHFIKQEVKEELLGRNLETEVLMAPFSEIKRNIELLDMPNKEKMIKALEPNEKGDSRILHAKVAFSAKSQSEEFYTVMGETHPIKEVIRAPFMGNMPNLGGMDTIVVSDKAYEKLKQEMGSKEYTLNAMNFTDPEDSLELVASLARIIPDYKNQVVSYIEFYTSKLYIMGSFYFLGIVLSLIFMLTAFSTIYFKCLSDAKSDKRQYGVLRRLGVSRRAIRNSIYLQNSIAVILPAAIGMIHSLVAIKVLEGFMHLNFLESKLIGIGTFIIVMILFFGFISGKYVQMVSEKR